MIIPVNANKKNDVDKEKSGWFMISKINYELSKSKFIANLEGKFDSLIKLTKTKIVPKTIHSITIELTKDLVTIKIYFIEKMNKVQCFTLLEKKVDSVL